MKAGFHMTVALPTRGGYCYICEQEVKVPTPAPFYPVCREKLEEEDVSLGMLWEGHLDFMAWRRAIKLFLAHEALELPVRKPYPVEYGGRVG